MQFGVREICDVVFKAKTEGYLNKKDKKGHYVPGQPVLYIDTAKTSTLEGAASTVYATGGKGNSRLIAWEGEKTLTFTVEDALLSEIGFAVLSGAGLFDNTETKVPVYVHKTVTQVVDASGNIDLTEALENKEQISDNSPIFVMVMEDGSVTKTISGCSVGSDKKSITGAIDNTGSTVLVDFYVVKESGVTTLTIDSENFAGYYYVEASTLFRRQTDGKDLPAELIFPNVKIQSNFTFTMAATGDPSTFTFTMDAMPGYTRFDRDKKVLCAIQVVQDTQTDLDGQANVDSTGTQAEAYIEYPTDKEVVTIKLYSADGTVQADTITAIKDSTIKLSTLADTATKKFVGWATTVDAIEATYKKEEDYIASADVTLYAAYSTT